MPAAEAVDWMALIYSRNGLLYRFDIDSGVAEQIDMGFAASNNNDHALSFDGRRQAHLLQLGAQRAHGDLAYAAGWIRPGAAD
jgi:hypothetical protein